MYHESSFCNSLQSAQRVRPQRKQATSGNPIKQLAQRSDILTSYSESRPSVTIGKELVKKVEGNEQQSWIERKFLSILRFALCIALISANCQRSLCSDIFSALAGVPRIFREVSRFRSATFWFSRFRVSSMSMHIEIQDELAEIAILISL